MAQKRTSKLDYIIKIGTNCLFDSNNNIDFNTLFERAKEIENLKSVLVVSGAIALGKKLLCEQRPNDQLKNFELQTFASVGQAELMGFYKSVFNKPISQILLTKFDLNYSKEINKLISNNINQGIVSIINYNDAVDFEEIRKDNDKLAYRILEYTGSKNLILLGRYDGFYKEGRLVKNITNQDEVNSLYKYCNEKSSNGGGGFETKLDIAKKILKYDKEMIIGNVAYSLDNLINYKVNHTRIRRPEKYSTKEGFE